MGSKGLSCTKMKKESNRSVSLCFNQCGIGSTKMKRKKRTLTSRFLPRRDTFQKVSRPTLSVSVSTKNKQICFRASRSTTGPAQQSFNGQAMLRTQMISLTSSRLPSYFWKTKKSLVSVVFNGIMKASPFTPNLNSESVLPKYRTVGSSTRPKQPSSSAGKRRSRQSATGTPGKNGAKTN